MQTFDIHMQTLVSTLDQKLKATEVLAEEAKKAERLARRRATTKERKTTTTTTDIIVSASAAEDEDKFAEPKKRSLRKTMGLETLSDFSHDEGTLLCSGDASLSSSAHGLSDIDHLSESDHGLDGLLMTTTAVETVTGSRPPILGTRLRSMSVHRQIGDHSDIQTVGSEEYPRRHSIQSTASTFKVLRDTTVSSSPETLNISYNGQDFSESTTIAAVSDSIASRYSSSPTTRELLTPSPPLPKIIVPELPIRRNSNSSTNLAALVDINANPNTNATTPTPTLRVQTYEELSKPPANEEEIDYGDSCGFQPNHQREKNQKRRGSKTLSIGQEFPSIGKQANPKR